MNCISRLIATISSLALLTSLAFAQEELLRPGDQINLKIAGVPAPDIASVSGLYTVSGTGKIRLPHLEIDIQAAGLPPSRLAMAIESAYQTAEIYTKPTIIINVDGIAAARFVSISSEVKQPGDVPFRPDLTLLSAISGRGGFTDFADTRHVKLIRGNQTTVHDMRKISENPERDVKLRPGDRIIVPQRGIFK